MWRAGGTRSKRGRSSEVQFIHEKIRTGVWYHKYYKARKVVKLREGRGEI